MSVNHFVQRKRVLGFYFFDRNKDGVLRAENVGKVTATTMNHEVGSEGYKKIVESSQSFWSIFGFADTDGDGAVTNAEFVAAIAKMADAPNGKANFVKLNNGVFNAIDANGNGALSKDEYCNFLKAGGVNREAAETAFKKLDVDGSGVITRDEFAECAWEYWHATDRNARGNWFFGNF